MECSMSNIIIISGVMPGPANPAMQGAAQKGGRHIGKFKKWLYVTVVFSREKPLKWQYFLEFSMKNTIFVHF